MVVHPPILTRQGSERAGSLSWRMAIYRVNFKNINAETLSGTSTITIRSKTKASCLENNDIWKEYCFFNCLNITQIVKHLPIAILKDRYFHQQKPTEIEPFLVQFSRTPCLPFWLAWSFRGLLHYNHGGKHGSIHVDMVLEQTRFTSWSAGSKRGLCVTLARHRHICEPSKSCHHSNTLPTPPTHLWIVPLTMDKHWDMDLWGPNLFKTSHSTPWPPEACRYNRSQNAISST